MIKNLDYQVFLQRESDFYHEPTQHEHNLYELIINGDVEGILENKRLYGHKGNDGKGILSKDALRNQIYHTVIHTALVTRVCTNAGLPHETAFTLSDMYIRQADVAQSVKDVVELNDRMVLDFASHMKKLCYLDSLSPVIRTTINFIIDHLHKKITTDELAKHVNLNRSYLSVLFKKEVGRSIHEYIKDKRMETAKNMLRSRIILLRILLILYASLLTAISVPPLNRPLV
ncbi:hypothetical protein J42TS3_20020 [Paenibacillus vini]|uniref:HTH araC/xylS-type domain-containing protein n=1 Tax=Paenibacillus vini TaxID=1476024 RepID=A0ABQ4MAF4_9BACL|nr:AraC family transcriptional regulator [Paenibacillus vini]GIP52967.1 hypothetical protein J42TS3_20020 [Paenibacillus vini]